MIRGRLGVEAMVRVCFVEWGNVDGSGSLEGGSLYVGEWKQWQHFFFPWSVAQEVKIFP